MKKAKMKWLFIPILTCFSLFSFGQKEYQKEYYENGILKEEGWVLNDQKTGYWKFYYSNGNIKEEGHFKFGEKEKYWYSYNKDQSIKHEGHFTKGQKAKWWIYYQDGIVNHKCQYHQNQKNGYCLIYEQGELVKASKFKGGKKVKEWTDLESFKKDNKLSDLR